MGHRAVADKLHVVFPEKEMVGACRDDVMDDEWNYNDSSVAASILFA
jgi:hypothetical protein